MEGDLAALRTELGAGAPGESPPPTAPTRSFSRGPFVAVGESEEGFEYRWPPDQVEHYRAFQRFKTPSGLLLGIGKAEPVEFYGRKRLYAVVHEVGRRDQLNALVVFASADNFDTSKELLALVKGKGDGGRQMFRPGDALPAEYRDAPIENFSARVTGPRTRNGLAVVCHKDDYDTMLSHAVVRKSLRHNN